MYFIYLIRCNFLSMVKTDTLCNKFYADVSVNGGHIDTGSSGECHIQLSRTHIFGPNSENWDYLNYTASVIPSVRPSVVRPSV